MVKKVKVSVDKLVERIKNKGIVKIIPEPGFNLFVYHPLEQYLRKERVVYDLKGNIEEDLKINLNKIEVVYPLNQETLLIFIFLPL